jgi:hypothetical protein
MCHKLRSLKTSAVVHATRGTTKFERPTPMTTENHNLRYHDAFLGHQRCLRQGMPERLSSIIDGMQEAQEFPTKLPVLRFHSTFQQADGIFIVFIKLLKIMQHQ